MKIKILTLSAFGSFAGKTDIDFEKMGQHGVFAVTGDTGAGKTTIFDAISFALYGVSSGGESRRASRGFRSDYALSTTETYVTLCFEHKGKAYTITRSPEYERAKLKGEGVTVSPGKVLLVEEDSAKTYERQSDVQQKVQEILGLNAEQFAQTMMIAQGDFLKILQAPSAARKSLLQQVFRTHLYERLLDAFKQENDLCQQKQRQMQDKMAEALRAMPVPADFERLDALRDLLQGGRWQDAFLLYDGVLPRWRQTAADAVREQARGEEALMALRMAAEAARQKNEKLDALADLTLRLKALEDKRGDMDALAERTRKAKAAQALEPLEAGLLKAQRTLSDILQEGEKTKRTLEDIRPQMERLEAAMAQDKPVLARREAQEELALKLRDMAPLQQAAEDAAAQAERLTRLRAERAKESVAADRAYADTKESYYQNQGAMLAQTLRAGQPCPVCGATDHPAPRQAPAGQAQVTRAVLESAEQQAWAAKRRLDETEQSLRQNEEKRAEAAGALEHMRQEAAALLPGLAAMGCPMPAEGEWTALNGRQTAAWSRQLTAQTAQAQKTYAAAQEALHRLQVEREGKMSAIETLRRQYAQQKQTLDAETRDFQSKRQEAGFDTEADYQAAKWTRQQSEQAEMTLKSYADEGLNCRARMETLRQDLPDEERADTAVLARQQAETEHALQAQKQRSRLLDAGLEKIEDALRIIRTEHKKLESESKRWTYINEIYLLLAGNAAGKTKLSFETYVLRHYFKQVVYAANERLIRLTEDGFLLRIKREGDNKRSQTGLDLEVFDRQTGKWRDIHTLSGGESFMASLSMALGLSDVVQAQSGAAKLETMFIDEGFGTLDEQALKKAMDMLTELADGKRLIGVISHVPQLKDRIEKKVLVKKTPHGSTVELVY